MLGKPGKDKAGQETTRVTSATNCHRTSYSFFSGGSQSHIEHYHHLLKQWIRDLNSLFPRPFRTQAFDVAVCSAPPSTAQIPPSPEKRNNNHNNNLYSMN